LVRISAILPIRRTGGSLKTGAIGNGHLHIYWLLPIAEREHDYKVQNGADALCQSLAMLDTIMSPDWEYRYYSFDYLQ
jgi:hypothetical protein